MRELMASGNSDMAAVRRSVHSAHPVAGDEMPVPNPNQRWDDRNVVWQAQGTWDLAVVHTLMEGPPRGIGHRHRGEQPLRVRMLRIAEHGLAWADFDDLAEIHHGYPMRDPLDDSHVVRDEQIGDAESGLQSHQQIDNLGTDRHVEGRDRLIGDDYFGVARQRPGNAHTLALPA